MKKVNRFETHLKLDGIRVDENGFLRSKAFATRTGVFTYRKADGTVFRELRLPEEVFNEDSMKTLRMVPVTNEHPKERIVNAKNAKRLQVGSTGEVFQEDRFLGTEIAITDGNTIDEVNAGKEELSCGYMCELDETSGIYEGERYDAIQRNIRYNHVALVAKGRAGAEVKLHLDSEDAVLIDEDSKERIDMKMKKMKLNDEIEIELPEADAAKLDGFLKKMKAEAKKDSAGAETEKEVLEAKNEKLQAKVDFLSEENEKLKEESKTDSAEVIAEKVKEGVKSRLELERKASKFLKEDSETAEMSEKDIKIAVIKSKNDKFDAEGKSDVYIDAAFDHILDTHKEDEADPEEGKKQSAYDKVSGKVDSKNDKKEESAEEARQRMMNDSDELWKKPLNPKK